MARRRPGAEDDDDAVVDGIEGLVFEDPFGDEFEEEEYVDDGDEDGADQDEEGMALDDENEETAAGGSKQVWRPGIDRIEEGEALEYDPSAYVMYHAFKLEWPCLSFDVIRDSLGDGRQRFPMTMFVAVGSQADRADKNKITVLRFSDLNKTQMHEENSDDEHSDDGDDNADEDPTIEHCNIPHNGAVNRIRCMPQNPGIIGSMSDTGHVNLFDASSALRVMMQNAGGPRPVGPTAPIFTFRGHATEGYAIDWSPVHAGRLATGDCAGAIHIWNMGASTSAWTVDPAAYRGHTGPVEDIQWSPTEATVFCSASSDNSVKIWDVRGKTGPQISFNAHDSDVNVISWNRSVSYLLASGSDDGSFKVWDLRAIRSNAAPLANFRYHTGPITSIEWAPHDESILCVSSADNQVTVWDLSVEADEGTTPGDAGTLGEFPPQLLFIHQGQSNVKEVHFHPQIPGTILSTAEDSFNVFKPAITVASS